MLLRLGQLAERPAEPRALLRRAVVNAALNWLRGEQRRHDRERRLVTRVAPGADVSTSSAPTRVVLAGLDTLSDRRRVAIVLRYWLDWNDQEIADSLGCARSTVRVLTFRGLRALRTYLEAQGVTP